MRLFILFIALSCSVIQLTADTKTTRRNLKATTADSRQVDASALTPAADSISISDYDKPLRSTTETIFVTNRCSTATGLISITITYLSVNGEMLHKRTVNLPCSVPPGETRQVSFRAWDRQQAYYHHSTRVTPRSHKAIPYKTEITVNGAVFQ